MFLFLSKLFLVFLHPVNWVLGLLILRYFVVRNSLKRALLTTAIIIFFIFSNKALYTFIVIQWQPPTVQLNGKIYSAGVLLGGISMFSKNGQGYFGDASDRYIQAHQLYQQGIIKKIIISGGRITSDVPREATFVAAQLLKSGVASQDIIIEDQSKNTLRKRTLYKINH